jgi:hypothetical protein
MAEECPVSKRHRREFVRLLPWVEASLAKRLAAYSAATGISASAVVRVALRQYLDQTSDATLLMRRLDRLGRAGARMHRDLVILSEAFALWTKLWFAHTPNVPDDAKPFARASAESRYRQFVDYLAEQLTGGHRFLDDLPHEVVADEAELANVAAQASPPAASTEPPTPVEDD